MAKDTKMKTIEERIYQKLIENGYLSEPRLPLEAVSTEECIEMMRELVTEQKAIDEESYTEEMRKLNEEWEENLAECKRQRDAYYDELQSYRQAEAEQREEIQRFKKFLEESAMTDEEYLNSKIEAYGKAHPDGNKEDLELLAEMRGYDKEE